jgi:hypothetical protein
MSLPKAIQQQAAEADAIAERIALADPSQLVVNPETGEPLNAPATPAAPAVTPPAPAPDVAAIEQKYRSIQGKYDAEVPILRNQAQTFERINATLSARLAAAEEELQRARSQPVPAVPTVPVVAANAKDVETFGSDLIDLITRVSAAQAETIRRDLLGAIQQVDRAVGQTKSEVGTVKASQQLTDRALYEQRLSEAIPNWREINAKQEWLVWLGEHDAVLGKTRQEALTEAYNAYDSGRTVAFLKTYLELERARTPAPRLTPQEELARQVSPRTNVNQTTQVPDSSTAQKRQFTQAEIGDFYKSVLQGKWKADPAGKAAMEKAIDEAVAEGRVR